MVEKFKLEHACMSGGDSRQIYRLLYIGNVHCFKGLAMSMYAFIKLYLEWTVIKVLSKNVQ